MSADTDTDVDYKDTLFLPQTDFPMRAGLPKREPDWLAHWEKIDVYGRLRAAGNDRPKYELHDGPPYANGHLHIGHALNKILKDFVVRSQQMLGHDSRYIPGWDCHGLPIEWKIEEQYREKGKNKDDVADQRTARRMPPLCRALDRRPARGVQAAGRHRRVGRPLPDHELRRRGGDRRGIHEVRHERHSLPGVQAGDVVGGREDRAGRGRGRVPRAPEPHDLGEVPGRPCRSGASGSGWTAT